MKKLNHWRLLADLNISIKTVEFLISLGIDIKRIDKSLSKDQDVIELAQKENRIIITFDKDFGEIYYFHKEKSITVIVLSVEDQTAEAVNLLLDRFFSLISDAKITNKLIILYEHRYRIVG